MPPRLAVVLGLLAGVLAATLILVAVVAFVPSPSHATPAPSVAEVSPSVGPSSAPASPGSSAAPSPGGSAEASAIAPGSASPSASGSPTGSGSPSASLAASGGLFGVGAPAPALKVTRVGGGTIDLAALKGKPVWVNFMQTTCPPCIDEFPLMNGFATRYASSGLEIVAVDIKEDEGSVAAFAEGLNTRFPVALDPDGTAQRAWGALALPVHFWIDKDGIVRAGALGGIGPDIMATNLQKILPGTTVTP